MKNKVIILISILVMLTLTLMFALTPRRTLNIKNIVDISYMGFNNNAELSVKLVKYKFLNELGLSNFKKGEIETLNELYNSLEIKISSYTGISNGDKISVKVLHDKELSKKLEIKVKNAEFNIKVKGLYDSLEETINVQSTARSGGNRLRVVVDEVNNKIHFLLSRKIQKQDLLTGTMATGIKTGLKNLTMKANTHKIVYKNDIVYQKGYDMDNIALLEGLLEGALSSILFDITGKNLEFWDVLSVSYGDLVGKELRFEVYSDTHNKDSSEEYTIKFYDAGIEVFDPHKSYEIIDDKVVETNRE